MNRVAIEAMMRALGIAEQPLRQRDLQDIAGAGGFDSVVCEELERQRHIDPDLW